jgi:hypothetical protein
LKSAQLNAILHSSCGKLENDGCSCRIKQHSARETINPQNKEPLLLLAQELKRRIWS